jgi:hypothetical protein
VAVPTPALRAMSAIVGVLDTAEIWLEVLIVLTSIIKSIRVLEQIG